MWLVRQVSFPKLDMGKLENRFFPSPCMAASGKDLLRRNRPFSSTYHAFGLAAAFFRLPLPRSLASCCLASYVGVAPNLINYARRRILKAAFAIQFDYLCSFLTSRAKCDRFPHFYTCTYVYCARSACRSTDRPAKFLLCRQRNNLAYWTYRRVRVHTQRFLYSQIRVWLPLSRIYVRKSRVKRRRACYRAYFLFSLTK